MPRKYITGLSSPGAPPRSIIVRPETCPCKALAALGTVILLNSSPFTFDTAPLVVTLRCTPYPTTTTSLKVCESSCSLIVMLVCLPTGTSREVYPMKDTWMILLSLTSSLKFPSISVMVPLDVPLSITLAPIIDSPA